MRPLISVLIAAWLALLSSGAPAQEVPLRALGRFDGWRENALIGYGIVTGLSGSGDTRRSEVTRQALRNVLGRLGTAVTEDQLNSRNVAVVIVTATLPASANPGDRIDAVVSSIGDARSLAGGGARRVMFGLLRSLRSFSTSRGSSITGTSEAVMDNPVKSSTWPSSRTTTAPQCDSHGPVTG